MIVNYQPVIDLTSGNVAKVEVLSRAEQPGKTITDVVRSAEQSGDIKKMTDRVMEIAFSEWKKYAHPKIGLSVNISMRNLDEKDFPKRVTRALKKHRFDPTSLWFEIDEKAQKLTNGEWLARMRELASTGVRFSVDSFGAGELSQATIHDLSRMPIAELKIDGRVVADADHNMDHRNDITATVRMARQLHLATSAKGIERAEIAGLIGRMGITYGQGYFFARPLPIGTIGTGIDTFRYPFAGAVAT
jgi:EAL domain-containing protein (putative c-di-GMP-specific phosphodiesterase class I)